MSDICPDCGMPVTQHDMFNPPMCPVIRIEYPVWLREALARGGWDEAWRECVNPRTAASEAGEERNL